MNSAQFAFENMFKMVHIFLIFSNFSIIHLYQFSVTTTVSCLTDSRGRSVFLFVPFSFALLPVIKLCIPMPENNLRADLYIYNSFSDANSILVSSPLTLTVFKAAKKNKNILEIIQIFIVWTKALELNIRIGPTFIFFLFFIQAVFICILYQ